MTAYMGRTFGPMHLPRKKVLYRISSAALEDTRTPPLVQTHGFRLLCHPRAYWPRYPGRAPPLQLDSGGLALSTTLLEVNGWLMGTIHQESAHMVETQSLPIPI